tara:strand:+ start:380 stop:541 length:162 start_codon:yes stop_codon:yes gene_type:complete
MDGCDDKEVPFVEHNYDVDKFQSEVKSMNVPDNDNIVGAIADSIGEVKCQDSF